jgi:ABC-2 type transport system ATP-binding protein
VAFDSLFERSVFDGIQILDYTQMGSVATFIARGCREEVVARIREMNPLLLDVLPLNLEEVFVYEMEALGYAFKDVLM